MTKVPIPFLNKTQRGGARAGRGRGAQEPRLGPQRAAGRQGRRRPPPPAPPAPAAPTRRPPSARPSAATGPVPVVVAPAAATDRPPRRAERPPVPAEANARRRRPIRCGDLARARAGTGSAADGSAPDPFMYFVQAGAFRTTEDAEAQRAKLSLMGVEAKVTEREQAGRTGLPRARGPLQQEGRCRPAEGTARRRRPRNRAGARQR